MAAMRRASRSIAQIFTGKRKRNKFNPFQENMPMIIEVTVSFLEKHAIDVEGLFRLSGEFKKVELILKGFDKNKQPEWDKDTDPHLVAGVLKSWLCELEAPLLTWELHDAFIAAQASTAKNGALRRLATVIELLPPANKMVFKRLLQLFVKVDAQHEKNKMAASNLAIVFAPTLLRYAVADLTKMLAHSEAANRVILLCIQNYVELFENSEKWINKKNLQERMSNIAFDKTVKKGGLMLARKLIAEQEQIRQEEEEREEEKKLKASGGAKKETATESDQALKEAEEKLKKLEEEEARLLKEDEDRRKAAAAEEVENAKAGEEDTKQSVLDLEDQMRKVAAEEASLRLEEETARIEESLLVLESLGVDSPLTTQLDFLAEFDESSVYQEEEKLRLLELEEERLMRELLGDITELSPKPQDGEAGERERAATAAAEQEVRDLLQKEELSRDGINEEPAALSPATEVTTEDKANDDSKDSDQAPVSPDSVEQPVTSTPESDETSVLAPVDEAAKELEEKEKARRAVINEKKKELARKKQELLVRRQSMLSGPSAGVQTLDTGPAEAEVSTTSKPKDDSERVAAIEQKRRELDNRQQMLKEKRRKLEEARRERAAQAAAPKSEATEPVVPTVSDSLRSSPASEESPEQTTVAPSAPDADTVAADAGQDSTLPITQDHIQPASCEREHAKDSSAVPNAREEEVPPPRKPRAPAGAVTASLLTSEVTIEDNEEVEVLSIDVQPHTELEPELATAEVAEPVLAEERSTDVAVVEAPNAEQQTTVAGSNVPKQSESRPGFVSEQGHDVDSGDSQTESSPSSDAASNEGEQDATAEDSSVVATKPSQDSPSAVDSDIAPSEVEITKIDESDSSSSIDQPDNDREHEPLAQDLVGVETDEPHQDSGATSKTITSDQDIVTPDSDIDEKRAIEEAADKAAVAAAAAAAEERASEIQRKKAELEQRQKELEEKRLAQEAEEEKLRQQRELEKKKEEEERAARAAEEERVRQMIEEKKRRLLEQKQALEAQRLKQEEERVRKEKEAAERKQALEEAARKERLAQEEARKKAAEERRRQEAERQLELEKKRKELEKQRAELEEQKRKTEEERRQREAERLKQEAAARQLADTSRKAMAAAELMESTSSLSSSPTKSPGPVAASSINRSSSTGSPSRRSRKSRDASAVLDDLLAGADLTPGSRRSRRMRGGSPLAAEVKPGNQDGKQPSPSPLSTNETKSEDPVKAAHDSYMNKLLEDTELLAEEAEKDIEDPDRVKQTTVLYTDGSRYVGGLKKNKWHGHGRCFFADGNVYEGAVENDCMHGVGTLIYANGDKYIGEWKEDMRHGKGRYQAANGDTYEGSFLNDKRHGKGTYVMASGDKYEGEFANGRPSGYGVYAFASGDIYKGDFLDDEFHGSGEYKSASGVHYVGNFVHGNKEGFGKYTLRNGDRYEGLFDNGKFHGRGEYFFSTGGKLVGEFVEGKPANVTRVN